MKIINALYSPNKGGLEQAHVNLSRVLTELGHEVISWASKKSPYLNELSSISQTEAVFDPRGNFDFLTSIKSSLKIFKHKPDLVISHNSRSTITLKRALTFRQKTPLLAFSHSHNLKLIQTADFVAVLTESMRKDLIATGFNKEKICLIPNYVFDRPPYKNKQLHTPIRLGFLGRNTAEKGLDILLHSFSKLIKKKINIELRIAGCKELDSNKVPPRLKNELGKSIKLDGWVTDKSKWFDEIDILVIPSLYESFGIVALEAAINSCPVIASNATGLNEQITDLVDGLIFPVGDYSSLANTILYAIEKPQLLSRFALNSYKRSEIYTADAIKQKLNNCVSKTQTYK